MNQMIIGQIKSKGFMLFCAYECDLDSVKYK